MILGGILGLGLSKTATLPSSGKKQSSRVNVQGIGGLLVAIQILDFFKDRSRLGTIKTELTASKTPQLDVHGPSRWAWSSPNHMASISSTVYEHISNSVDSGAQWSGWNQIWKLSVIPRVKTFIWKLAHGKLSTGAYLYSLNIGPYVNCYFCDLEEDSIDHTIWKCSKVKHIWDSILASMNICPPDLLFLSSGRWLTHWNHKRMENIKNKALITSAAWLIWKERCNFIF
ncbi:uncharacterized protein LOC120263528 [Dioscorea cayenensis subsp. rotundata]|uniref:Uncharacterized protein LOC120263528 n=1 Tax=Dioscorea cayennensis subsp. rotundata TaxID=55577 RepID=A0AB40BKB8_DIOCR|nr:uncharacterized protein LOC120263528 [Dioscorea cayenensis subsp. rotundata]